MCLLTVFNDNQLIDEETWHVGWKRFRISSNLPDGQRYIYELDKKLLAKNCILCAVTHSRNYKSGFHVFLDKQDADLYYNENDYQYKMSVTCRVLYRNITSIGFNGDEHLRHIETTSGGLTVITNELYIQSSDWRISLQEPLK